MEAIPEIILLGKDIVDKPVWLWPFAGLIIYQKTSSLMEIEFTIADSVTLLALWEAQNEYHVVDEDDGYHATNRRRSDFGMDAISRCQYETSIDHLCQAGCIELESGTISFREKVVVEWETTG